MIIFGYVKSRRLGKSLGINNLPKKYCTYSCVYCQVGRTKNLTIKRDEFYSPSEIYDEVKKYFERFKNKIDYITFVPNGEPTLDINLGKTAKLLKKFGKVAIITNSSLIWDDKVKENLLNFDLVSFKIDTVNEKLWRFINRPHKALNLNLILENLLKFREIFRGHIITETMLINNIEYDLEEISRFLGKLKPALAYISIPIRPPAEKWVKPANEEILSKAYFIFSKTVKTKFLTHVEDKDFGITDDVVKDILSISSVHPLREEILREILKKHKSNFSVVKKLLEEGKLKIVVYKNQKFYIRKISN